MRRISVCALLIVVAGTAVLGCGAKQEAADTQTSTASAPTSGSSSPAALPANLDQGPRAGEASYDEAKAEVGEGLFQTKGCSACHGFGKRVSCPDLAGVSMRRTQAWLESQILHPDVMTKQDPIARQLFAQFSLQMPNQGLTQDEARSVIEFLKHKDHELAEKSATK